MPHEAVEKYMMIAGLDPDEAGKESKEAKTLADQFAEARTAPGIVSSGAYTAAYKQLTALPSTGGSWARRHQGALQLRRPALPRLLLQLQRGQRLRLGRVTGIAADGAGDVYAASADGGVWRSTTGGGHWQPISDSSRRCPRAT